MIICFLFYFSLVAVCPQSMFSFAPALLALVFGCFVLVVLLSHIQYKKDSNLCQASLSSLQKGTTNTIAQHSLFFFHQCLASHLHYISKPTFCNVNRQKAKPMSD